MVDVREVVRLCYEHYPEQLAGAGVTLNPVLGEPELGIGIEIMGTGILTIDLEGHLPDKRPEVVVSFTSARGPAATWVFKRNGRELSLIGLAEVDEAGDPSTLLRRATSLTWTETESWRSSIRRKWVLSGTAG